MELQQLANLGYHLRINPKLTVGLGILLGMLVFWGIGSTFSNAEDATPLSAKPNSPPSWDFPLGSDQQGRQMLAVLVHGTPLTFKLGLIAGAIGVGVGIILGFGAGYAGGKVDTIIKSSADVVVTIPPLAVLVVIASTFAQELSVESMALIVAALAWMWPTRAVRSQVLSMRESDYVEVAKLNGMNGFEIVIRELVPNLFPYLAASFVAAVAAGILAAIGLEALGLGPQNEPTMGMTIFWSMQQGALLRGMWWWWLPPIVLLVIMFIGLYLTSAGLDQLANPRLRTAA